MGKRLLIWLGFLMVGLGVAGIFLPLLPTTPFLLLAAYFFGRGSSRWHAWLLRHRHLGPYIHSFRSRRGLTTPQKIRIGCSFTVLIAISFYFAPYPGLRVFLVVLWAFWMFFLLRVRRNEDAPVVAEAVEEESS